MALPNFNDSSINNYFSTSSESALDSFVSDLKSDFDSAITSRFQMDSKYQDALKNTRNEFKEFVTGAIEHFVKTKKSFGLGTLTVSGIGQKGEPQPPNGLTIRCELTINGGINFDCEISWTKD
jgi:hypothetical protein